MLASALPVIAGANWDVRASQLGEVESSRGIEFLQFAAPEAISHYPKATSALAIHLEESHLSYSSVKRLMRRHAEAAAFSLYYGASTFAKSEIPVRAYDINPFVGGLLPSALTAEDKESALLDRRVMQSALDSATAISVSMTTNSNHRLAIKKESINALIEQWDKSQAIVTQSAGNRGTLCHPGKPDIVDQQESTFLQLADTYAKVGSAIIDQKDQAKIKATSSCSSPDIVALNPYEQGVRYRFIPTEEELKDLFALHRDRVDSQLSEKDLEVIRELRKKNADKEGYVTNIGGNSFIAPALAGYFAAAKEICPSLTEYDLLAGAFSAAVPISTEDGFPTMYASNGVLPYDDIRGGFGFVDAKAYKSAIVNACATLKVDPRLQTVPVTVEYNFDQLQNVKTEDQSQNKIVAFDIDESALVFRVILVMEAENGGVPFSMTLVNPKGAKVRLRPANANSQKKPWGLATTNGFFGTDSKGRWKILLDKYKDITSLKVRISAVKQHGLVSHIITQSKRVESSQ